MAISVNDRIDDPSKANVEHYVGLEHLDSDSLKIRRWGSPSDVEATKLIFRKGDIIFGRRRAYQRKLAVADFDGICSAHAMVLRAKPEVVLPEFLPFFMQSDLFMHRAVEISVGSLSPTINWKTLAQQEFALPPLDEQQYLVQLLECSRETVESGTNAVSQLMNLRRAAIDELCNASIGKEVQLSKVCQMQNGRAFPGDQYQESGIRLLRPGNLGGNGYFDWSPERSVWMPRRFIEETAEFLIHPGDVVINLTAQSLEDGFMGRVCIAREGDYSLLNQRVGRFICDLNFVEPAYIFRVLQTSRFQQHAISMCEGTKVKHLYWRHLEKFRLTLPSLNLQREIIAELDTIDISLDSLVTRHNRQGWLHQILLNRTVQSHTSVL